MAMTLSGAELGNQSCHMAKNNQGVIPAARAMMQAILFRKRLFATAKIAETLAVTAVAKTANSEKDMGQKKRSTPKAMRKAANDDAPAPIPADR
jgi:hypothetical protein